MIFVLLSWIFLLMTVAVAWAWMQSSNIYRAWPRVRNTSALLMAASAFFLLLHFALPAQEVDMEEALVSHQDLLMENMERSNISIASIDLLFGTHSEHVKHNLTQFSVENTVIHDMMQARLGSDLVSEPSGLAPGFP